jgi:hypothetical protein
MDQLYNLMDLVSPGGCVVVDDWAIKPTQRAVVEFLDHHDIGAGAIKPIDSFSAYFCLEQRVALKHHIYKEFNAGRWRPRV